MGVVNFLKMLLVNAGSISADGENAIIVSFVVSITIMITIIVAKIVGSVLPIAAKKIGFDPAVMASPFITTIVDAIALLVYFNIGQIFLGI